MSEFLSREELAQLQDLAEAEHGHPLQALRRQFYGAVPVFLVDDIAATCEYYERVLGFDTGFKHGDPPYFASVYRGNAVIHLNLAEPPGSRNSGTSGGDKVGSDAYFIVRDVDEICEEFRRAGASVTLQPESFEYGMREFQVEDCNGYRLTLAEGIFQET